jgi:hypothetical protein
VRVGGERDVNDVEAEVEVLAEALGFDGRLEVAIGGGDDADVDRDLRRASERANQALLKHAKELRLKAERHVASESATRASRSLTSVIAGLSTCSLVQ